MTNHANNDFEKVHLNEYDFFNNWRKIEEPTDDSRADIKRACRLGRAY